MTLQKKQSNSLKDILNKDIQFGSGKWNDKRKEKFYSEFHMLFHAGIDVNTVLDMMSQSDRKDKENKVIDEIKENIVKGGTVESAMAQTGQFSSYELFSIRIGEESGRLAIVLKELQRFFHKKIAQRRQLISALMYPMLVMVVAFAVVVIMLAFVVPMFEEMFKRFDGELPWLTIQVIKFSDFFKGNLKLIFIAIFSFIGGLVFLRTKVWFQQISDQVILRIPVLGSILLKNHLFRMSQSLNLLISSNTPLDQALLLVSDMIDFHPLKDALKTTHKQLLTGTSFHESISSFSFIPSQMKMLIKVGEEVNQLDNIFKKLSDQYEEELDHQGKLIGNILEPLLIVFLGFVVVTILVAMYGPLFNLNSAI
jgi:type IV pilus assembly protein PilC